MPFSLPILTFHTLDERPSVISVSPGLFQRGMAKLHENGYQALSLLETVDYLKRGQPFPDSSFLLTFDDGYQTMYDEAFPVLQRYGMSATVFLTVGEKKRIKPEGRLPSLEGRSMLSWPEIQEMQRCGINFGAHTLTHPDLTRLPSHRIETEVYDSKAIIEDTLGSPVTCFAYPFGRYDARSLAAVRDHFICACSDKLGLITPSSNPYTLERVDTYYLRTDRLFKILLMRLFPWYVRALNIPRQIRRTVQHTVEGWNDIEPSVFVR